MYDDDLNKYYDQMLKIYTELGYDENFIGQWTLPLQDAQRLVEILQVCRPQNILEVGTFVGLTTLLMALFSSPETHIHTIDPNFPLQVEMGSMRCKIDDFDTSIKSQDLGLQAAERLGVEHKITFHAGGFSTGNTFASYNLSPSSRINIIGPEVCKSFGPFDFIFIDGLHYEEDVLSDLNLAAEHLILSGTIAMHDVLGAWGSNVRRAVFRFLEKRADFFFSHGKYSDIYDSIGLLQHFPNEQSQFVKKNYNDLKKGGLVQDKMFPNLGAVLINMFSPSSVIQIGSNVDFLEQLANFGVSEVCALYPKEIQQSFIPIKQFNPQERYHFEKKYDLCLCLDITDSFSEESFDNVIQACVDASDTVIFACTPPGELGCYQYNDRPLSYWIEKFYEKGYLFFDAIRPVLEPINYSEIIYSDYQFNSTYLMNLYLVKKVNNLDLNMAAKSVLKDVVISKERRIEDLCLQLLYKNNILNYFKRWTDKYKGQEENLIGIINNQNERLDTINIFNKEVIRNTTKRVGEIIKKLFIK